MRRGPSFAKPQAAKSEGVKSHDAPYRAIRCRKALTVNHPRAPKHVSNNPVRIEVATGIEIPMPVAIATYAARHIGHLGSTARITLGTIHLVLPSIRRAVDFSPDEVAVLWQHEWVVIGRPSLC